MAACSGAIQQNQNISLMADSDNSIPHNDPLIYNFVSPKTQAILRSTAKQTSEAANLHTNNMSTEQT